MSGLTRALRLLTVLPAPGWLPEPRGPAGRASAWFPVVGALVGCLPWAVLLVPVARPVAAAGALLAWAAVTGALHEDGLADSADALFLTGDRARRREVLADPRIGAYGLTSLVTVLLLRFALLTEVRPVAVLAAAVVGRWVMALTLARAPSLRERGLGAAYGEGAGAVAPTLAAAGLLGVLALGVPPGAAGGTLASVATSWALGGAVGGAFAWLAVRRLGGLNGDGHGAAGYLAETAALLPFAVLQ